LQNSRSYTDCNCHPFSLLSYTGTLIFFAIYQYLPTLPVLKKGRKKTSPHPKWDLCNSSGGIHTPNSALQTTGPDYPQYLIPDYMHECIAAFPAFKTLGCKGYSCPNLQNFRVLDFWREIAGC
jgi:hypothetical protein